MCGISGILTFNSTPVERGEIELLNSAQSHRGPDGEGIFILGNIALGHRRLSIIDPKHGTQPMCNENRSVWLVANGEIYNFYHLKKQLEQCGHKFKSECDVEVILHGYEEWGKSVVEKLRGMFAFAIWDSSTQEIFLARDRLGIKPLCYSLSKNRLVFASELQALRQLNTFNSEIDLEALDLYLHLQYIPPPQSIYKSIKKLPPAHTLTVSANGEISDFHCYWQMQWQPDHSKTEDEWIEILDSALNDAVKSHLVSDVPFGAFLSGGVDSSTIVGYMSRNLNQPVRSFTIGFNTGDCDEREFARKAAHTIGSQNFETVLELNVLNLLPQMVKHFGEPFGDSSSVCAWMVAQIASEKVPMILSGDGGDEIFAGYSYFPKLVANFPELSRFNRFKRYFGNQLRSFGFLTPLPDLATEWYSRSPFFNDARRLRIWKPDYRYLIESTRNWNQTNFNRSQSSNTLDRVQEMDINTYLTADNLTKVDITSMAHGLEVRVPLLDHLLVETVTKIPWYYRLGWLANAGDGDSITNSSIVAKKMTSCPPKNASSASWCGKYILKKASMRFYDWNFLNRPKKGFSIPIDQWFLDRNTREMLREVLLSQETGLSEWFNTQEIELLINEHGTLENHGHRLWSLLFLSEWKRSH